MATLLNNMKNQLNLHDIMLNVESVKKNMMGNFTNSIFCRDYRDTLAGKKLVFVSDEDDGIPIQNWALNSEKYHDIKVNPIKLVKKDKLVVGIDSSCIKIAEVEDGSLYTIKSSICISFKGRPLNHIKVGPFVFYINEEILGLLNLEHSALKLILFNDDYAKKFLRINLERYIQYLISKSINDSLILIDGSLRRSIFENKYYSISKIIENSIINKNSIIGISKNTKIKILKYMSYPLLKSRCPSFIDINLVITGLIKKIFGEHILAKFDDKEHSNILRADIVSFNNDVDETLGTLLCNEFFTNGYPSTLHLSHHVSTFSTSELSSIRTYIKSNYAVKELFHENARSSVLGNIWK
jgi:hypothetical protein